MTFLAPDEMKQWAIPIFTGLRGSHAHGTFIPPDDPNGTDDIDLCGVYFADARHYIGLTKRPETYEYALGHVDLVYYEFRHFVHLLLKNNPNVISWLWLSPSAIHDQSTDWQMLVTLRDLFLSKLCYNTFTGYSYSQLQKMERMTPEVAEEYQWLQENIEAAGFSPDKTAPSSYVAVIGWQERWQRIHSKYMSGFMGDKRRQKVLTYGYDVKAAAHLIRLLRMQVEILQAGLVMVDRIGLDADELIAIKTGKWSLERVKAVADELFAQGKAAAKNSPLPDKPQIEQIEPVVSRLLYRHIRSEYEHVAV